MAPTPVVALILCVHCCWSGLKQYQLRINPSEVIILSGMIKIFCYPNTFVMFITKKLRTFVKRNNFKHNYNIYNVTFFLIKFVYNIVVYYCFDVPKLLELLIYYISHFPYMSFFFFFFVFVFFVKYNC